MKNTINKLMNLVNKNRLVAIIAGVLAVVLVLVLVLPGGGSYKTPVTLMQDMRNAKSASAMRDATFAQLNGLCQDEVETVVDILWNTRLYAYLEGSMEDSVEQAKEQYGSDFKCTLKVVEKEKLDKDDLEDFREKVEELAEACEDSAQNLEDPDESWEMILEMLDLSDDDLEELAEAYGKMAKQLGKAKVTAGYELTLSGRIKGSSDSEELDDETTICVYKVNGRWIWEGALNPIVTLSGR